MGHRLHRPQSSQARTQADSVRGVAVGRCRGLNKAGGVTNQVTPHPIHHRAWPMSIRHDNLDGLLGGSCPGPTALRGGNRLHNWPAFGSGPTLGKPGCLGVATFNQLGRTTPPPRETSIPFAVRLRSKAMRASNPSVVAPLANNSALRSKSESFVACRQIIEASISVVIASPTEGPKAAAPINRSATSMTSPTPNRCDIAQSKNVLHTITTFSGDTRASI